MAAGGLLPSAENRCDERFEMMIVGGSAIDLLGLLGAVDGDAKLTRFELGHRPRAVEIGCERRFQQARWQEVVTDGVTCRRQETKPPFRAGLTFAAQRLNSMCFGHLALWAALCVGCQASAGGRPGAPSCASLSPAAPSAASNTPKDESLAPPDAPRSLRLAVALPARRAPD